METKNINGLIRIPAMAHPIPLRFPLIQSESPISPIITQAKLITIPNIPKINGKTVLTMPAFVSGRDSFCVFPKRSLPLSF